MSFDRPTRNLLARMVGQVRERLGADVADQLRRLGFQDDGTVLDLDRIAGLTEADLAATLELRALVTHFTASETGDDPVRRRAAYDRLVRDIGFTTFNRLVALRMAEERGLVIEAVGKGLASDGFQVYEAVARGALGTRAHTYRAYLECLYDELAQDLPLLFDRHAPESRIFPTERCLEDILVLLNDSALAHLWAEDEAIGWVYQYYNDPEERKRMRESGAPRTGRELAVRNQFFTPRYVVEFLTDNTLGRLWYEMRQGDTVLTDECPYLVVRRTEVFLGPSELAPAAAEADGDLNQDELQHQLVYVAYRARKDPRDLKVLDPACGSGHFLLYAFDLLETMYLESWSDVDSPPSEATGRTLRQDYPTADDLRRAMPGLALRHNLHGIDIDSRACQIAALALWLRAQRSYQQQGLPPAERSPLTKGNIVVAEPMPGERYLLEQFVRTLDPPLLGGLVKLVFDHMELAGEAGPLLRVEDALRDAIHQAKAVWTRLSRPQQLALLPELERQRAEQLSLFDVSNITDEDFWQQAEQRVLDALADYAQGVVNGEATQRRLFIEDTVQGFAFVDLLRRHYDAVLMNPPFGEMTAKTRGYIESTYQDSRQDLFACFVERSVKDFAQAGLVGLLSGEAGFFRRTLEPWRRNVLLERCTLGVMAHLGGHVLDGATVRTAAYVLQTPQQDSRSVFIRVVGREDRPDLLMENAARLRLGAAADAVFEVFQQDFEPLPYAVFGYWCSRQLRGAFAEFPALEGSGAQVRVGLQTSDDFRFLRVRWEVPPRHVGLNKTWAPFAKGGEYCPFHDDVHLVVKWSQDGSELIAFEGSVLRNVEFYNKPGLTYTPRTNKRFAPRMLPSGCAFANKGPGILTTDVDALALAALLNSRTVSYLLGLGVGGSEAENGTSSNSYEVGLVQRLPIPSTLRTDPNLSDLGCTAWQARAEPDTRDETTIRFVSPLHPVGARPYLSDTAEELSELRRREEEKYSLAQEEIDFRVRLMYGLSDSDWRDVEEHVGFPHRVRQPSATGMLPELAGSVVQYALGCAFQRWNPGLAVSPAAAPPMLGPLEVMPAIAPAGMPEQATDEPGLRVDDAERRDDLVLAVRQILELLWPDRSGAIEQEVCDALGVHTLRDYLARPGGFFGDHLKRYSKSRRVAPIYWPLSTASGSYTVWLYYHRLTSDTLYSADNRYVEPKVAGVERELRENEGRLPDATGRELVRLREQVETGRAFLAELREFRTELLRVAGLPYRPNLDDGVIINAAPLHKLFRLPKWAKDTRDTWQKLERGEYDWAHLAYTIWPERVQAKCRADRSLAIAHDLEALYVAPATEPRRRRTRAAVVEDDEDLE